MERVDAIASDAGVTRQTIHNILKANGALTYKRKSIKLECAFCGETFTKPYAYVKDVNYCSQQCFHAHRSIAGMYSERGSKLTALVDRTKIRKLSRQARKVVEESGIELNHGQVVHHINGDKSDNRVENLRVFDSHNEHMRFHHALRFASSG